MKKRTVIAFIFILTALVAAVYVNIMTGSVRIGAADVLAAFTGENTDKAQTNIILAIRLPRVLAAMILGGGLALSGYMLQTFFSNPIVGPFVLGISSGAKLAVAIALIFIVSGGGRATSLLLVGAAFIGALAVMGFVLAISMKVRSMGILVVCGIMTGYICSAATDLMVTFADDSDIVNLHNWSMGSLSGMNMHDIGVMTFITALCLAGAVLMSKPMASYRLGEAYAGSAGVNITLLRVSLILLSSLLAATVTAFAGPISFVGIAVPHLFAGMCGTGKPKLMIPGCFLLGALVTLACDGVARTLFAPAEVSISSVTAVFLVPVVLIVMLRRRI